MARILVDAIWWSTKRGLRPSAAAAVAVALAMVAVAAAVAAARGAAADEAGTAEIAATAGKFEISNRSSASVSRGTTQRRPSIHALRICRGTIRSEPPLARAWSLPRHYSGVTTTPASEFVEAQLDPSLP